MRIRQLDSDVAPKTTEIFAHYVDGDDVWDRFYSQTLDQLDQRYCEDVVTPKYKELIARGAIINNHFRSVKRRTSSQVGQVSGKVRYYSTSDWGPVHGTFLPLNGRELANIVSGLKVPDHVATDNPEIQEALIQAWGSINQTDWMSLVSAKEAPETLNLLVDALKRGVKIYRAIRKVQLKEALRQLTPKGARNEYLQLRYAVRPLQGEVASAISALDTLSKIRERVTSRQWVTIPISHARYEGSDYRSIGPVNGGGGRIYFDYESQYTSEIGASVGVLADLRLEHITNSLLAFGLDRPFSSLWELVPGSFIADWCWNLGDLIAYYEPKPHINPLTSWVVFRALHSFERTAFPTKLLLRRNATSSTYNTVNDFGGTFSQVSGTAIDTLRVPNPSVHPTLIPNPSLDFLKGLDIAGILRGIRKK